MERKHGWKGALALGLSAVLLLSGCAAGGESKVGGKQPDPAPTPSPSAPVETDAPTDYSKYNAYVELSEKIYEIEDILDVYFTHVEVAPEFTLVEGGDYGAIKDIVQFYTANTYPCRVALEYADEEPAYPDVDSAVKGLGESPAQVMDALDDLAAYMRFDDYLEDNMAKAPEIHAAIWEALEDYDAYFQIFLAAMGDLADQTRNEDLEAMQENGQTILYNSLMMIYTSQDVMEEIQTQFQAADPAAGLPAIDLTNISPLVAQFQTAYDELIKALDDEEEREKVSSFTGKVGDSSVKLYTNKVNSLYNSMGSLAAALLQEGADYREAYNDLSEAVSSMIGGYNSIN